MFVWGRNNNHLFKQNHKKTYSLPQRMPLNKNIQKCVAGYDYVLFLASQSLYCYYQSAIYSLSHFKEAIDVATTDNMIVVVTQSGSALIAEFSSEKIMSDELIPSKIQVKETIRRGFMNYGDIFLLGEDNQVFHLKRNEWYETKSYSDPMAVEGLGGNNIKSIAPALNNNYFLTEDGKVFLSSKKDPIKVIYSKFQVKFVEIAASDYFIGIAQNGRMYVWGKYLQNVYDAPTEFGKISQKFKKIHLSCDNGFGITENGEGWVWGKNANGELGISDYQPRTQPFPLITMQNEVLMDFIIGEGYTMCLVQNPHSKKLKIKTYDKISETVLPTQEHKTSSNFMISSIPSISIAEVKKNSKSKSPNNAHLAKTELIRENPFKSQKESNTPTKNANRSKSPIVQHNRSSSKSPVAKYVSPYLDHQRQKSTSNCKQKKEYPKPSPRKAENQQLFTQIHSLQQENTKLKRMLTIKQEVIEDITHKIRLLQDAIDQHEKTLTNRDHLMQQYEKRQKQYLSHIDQLQKTIQSLMKSKTQRSNEDHFNGIFHELKTEFNKEKDYYMNKMKEYEDLLNNERSHYNTKIKELEEEIQTFRSSNENQNKVLYTLNDSRSSALCDRSHKDNMKLSQESFEKSRMLEENRHRMELIVSRIQDSKVRIGKSATKLNEFLGQ